MMAIEDVTPYARQRGVNIVGCTSMGCAKALGIL